MRAQPPAYPGDQYAVPILCGKDLKKGSSRKA